jgi:hypothetical protein
MRVAVGTVDRPQASYVTVHVLLLLLMLMLRHNVGVLLVQLPLLYGHLLVSCCMHMLLFCRMRSWLRLLYTCTCTASSSCC